MTYSDSIQQIQEAYSRNLLIPVVGSGVSMPFQLPDWKQLLLKAAEHFSLDNQSCHKVEQYLQVSDYLKAADEILSAGVTEYEMQSFVADYLLLCKQNSKKSAIESNYPDFAKMKMTRFLTTNYDRYLNDFTGGNSFYLENFETMPVNTFQLRQYDNSIIPIHGELNRPESIVLTRKSYERLYDSSNFDREFQYIRAHFTFLFIGFSFEDVYFKRLFEKILYKRFASRHFILFDESEKTRNPRKISELQEEYGVEAIFYDGSREGHAKAIHAFLENIIHYHDVDVDLSNMERLGKLETDEELEPELKRLLKEGREARKREELSKVFSIYEGIFHRPDFSNMDVSHQIDVIVSLIWYYGAMRDYKKAESYIHYVENSPVLCASQGKCAFMYAQILWNRKLFGQAKKVLDQHTGSGEKEKLYELFSDLCDASAWRWPDVVADARRLPIYAESAWSDDYCEEVRRKYLELRDKYINPDTFNLKGLKEYKDVYDQEFAYYWLGIAAGQIFHEHADAIQYLLRANELNPCMNYQEQLGFNYLEKARNTIRYRKNTKAYELDRRSLEKATICFRYAMQTQDPDFLKSLHKSCGAAYLECLYLMHRDYEFEQFWEEAYKDMDLDHKTLLYKAEVDARFLYQKSDEICDKLTAEEQLLIELSKDISIAGFYGNMGLQEMSDRIYSGITERLETIQNHDETLLEVLLKSGNMNFLDIALDCALFTGDLPLYERYYALSEKYRGNDAMLTGFREELKGNLAEAEECFRNYYTSHPDVSTFSILNSFYLRQGAKGHLEMRQKSLNIREEVIAGKGAFLFDECSFYEAYVMEQLQYWKDMEGTISLYVRFFDKFSENPEIHFELEEILKPLLFDYRDWENRCEWNRKILKESPKQVHQQFYRNILNLLISNYKLDEARELWKEIIEDLEIKHPERIPEYQFLQIITGRASGAFSGSRYGRSYYVEFIPSDMKLMEKYDEFARQCFGHRGKKVMLPMRVILIMFYLKRQQELSEFEKVYISYACSSRLQRDLCLLENPVVRAVLKWMESAENVVLFAPEFKKVCERLNKNPEESIRKVQMELYGEEHPEIRLLFPEMVI